MAEEKYKTLAECESAIAAMAVNGQTIPDSLRRQREALKQKEEERKNAANSDTPIYSTLVANYNYGVMPQEKKDCIESTVAQLLEDGPNANEPGLLLGKIQCGKTDTFESIIGLAFDKGIDICVVFTKGTKPLTQQTIKRMENDYRYFKPSNDPNQRATIRIHDIMVVWKNISREQVENSKTVIVCKKQATNLEHLMEMFDVRFPFLKEKKVLIVDDEADFASRNYKNVRLTAKYDEEGRPIEQERETELAVISRQIDEFRNIPVYCRYLQVTATPYCLYLQPQGVLNLQGKTVMPFRPRFTSLVPTHERYVGGNEYFELSQNTDSMYNHLFHPVDDKCIDVLGREDKRYLNNSISSSNIYDLTWAIVSYFMATAIRRIQVRETENKTYQTSALIHVEIDKKNHDWQKRVIERLINSITEVVVNNDRTDHRVWEAIDSVYLDLEESSQKAKSENLVSVSLPSKEAVIAEVAELLDPKKSLYTVQVVNSDKDVKSLLNAETGELELRWSANIFIGGNILDRGVTIKNMLCFFYGRNPKNFQQDTVLQHARMYGARSKEDMAVTRFHTTRKIYMVLKRMNELDNQLREWFIEGKDKQYNNAAFVAFDKDIKPCSVQKISASNTLTLKHHQRVLPVGMWTKDRNEVAVIMQEIDRLIEESAANQHVDDGVWTMSSQTAMRILDLIESTYEYDKKLVNLDHKNDIKELQAALAYCVGSNGGSNGKVYAMLRKDRNMSRVRDNGAWIDAPEDGRTDSPMARLKAIDAPVLMFLRQNGEKKTNSVGENIGWNNTPFYWPVLLTQKRLDSVMYTVEQSKGKRVLVTDDSDILAGIDKDECLDMTYQGDLEAHFGPEGTEYFDDDEGFEVETRSLKVTTAGRFIEKDDKGNYLLNPKVKFDHKHDQGVYSFNKGRFPFVLRPYKYMLLRNGRDQAASDLMLLELTDSSMWHTEVCSWPDENGDLRDRDNSKKILAHAGDVLVDKNLGRTIISDETMVQWEIWYYVKKVLKFKPSVYHAMLRSSNYDDQEEETSDNTSPAEVQSAEPQRRRSLGQLRVTMSYGAVIAQDNVTKTFCEALRSLGLARISKLKIMKSGVNLVSTENKLGNRQTQVGNFYIYTNMSTADKKKTLDKVVELLGEDVTVEIVD